MKTNLTPYQFAMQQNIDTALDYKNEIENILAEYSSNISLNNYDDLFILCTLMVNYGIAIGKSKERTRMRSHIHE